MFEEMLERLINEDQAGAEELFHEIVVEKSREIYENILAEETDEDLDEAGPDDGTRGGQKSSSGEDEGEVGDATGGKGTGTKGPKMPAAADKKAPKKKMTKEDEEVDESDDDLEEDFDLDEFEVEADDDMDMMGGDATDMLGDLGDDEDNEDEGDEGDMEDRVEDLEDALDELKAEFEKLMAGEEGEDHGDDMDFDMDMGDDDDEEAEEESFYYESDDEEVDESDDEEVDESDDEEVDEGSKSAAETMREYVEKVTASMGDNGANTKSAVAGKNDMGGTAGNIAQSKEEKGVEANKGALQGSALSDSSAKEDNAGNVNVPGGKASKSMKNQPAGHGAEKKGKPESADKGAGSTLNKVSTRAK